MKQYKSHKIVKAARIVAIDNSGARSPGNPLGQLAFRLDDGSNHVGGSEQFRHAKVGDYVVEYQDGYRSCSPAKAFEEGYTELTAAPAPAPAAASTGPAPRVEEVRINALMASLTYTTAHLEGTTSTVATARLPGGFVVSVGHDACVSAANFKAELGQQYAIEDAEAQARKKLWEFEGYALYLRLEQLRVAGVDMAMPAHQQRVLLERFELVEKADALAAFIGTRDQAGSIFGKLPEDEQTRLYRQLQSMRDYSAVLAERIAAFPKVAA